jgi:hypothetical protein
MCNKNLSDFPEVIPDAISKEISEKISQEISDKIYTKSLAYMDYIGDNYTEEGCS